MRDAYFSGHLRGPAGHGLHAPSATLGGPLGYASPRETEEILKWGTLDCALLGAVDQVEGEAVLWVRMVPDPWTVLTFWDRSVDTRGNCCASFLLKGALDFATALETAREAFPQVFSRFKFGIVPRPSDLPG